MSSDYVDGGVSYKSFKADTHRKIECNKLIKFHCVFSLLAFEETSILGARVYTLEAVLENGAVKGSIDWYCFGEGEKFTFEAEPSFMDGLQKIIVKYDLEKHDGHIYIANALPDMYGSKLDIRYDSGEYIYAHNNEECFLSMDMMEELVKLFELFCNK